ncbi:MAG: inverse autotransporter beta domain-containing protein [Deltaproteobacteria bacterium]|nr:inverse autotransporter beta domain-containing protein [Deltaproteobacteria bacterium]
MNHPRFSPGRPALGIALFCLLLSLNLACQGREQTFARPSETPAQRLAQARDADRNSEAEPVTPLETQILNRGLGFMGLAPLASPSEARALEERGFQRAAPDRPGTRLARTDPGQVADRLLRQAVSAGNSALNSMAEGWLSNYGRARVNLSYDLDSRFNGSADFLSPLYDSELTTLFYQIGFRTMTGDRLIGNFGLGQRFFPDEALALGYNFFLDYDYTRRHARGGAGLEFWAEWVRLAANYYLPLTGWKDSVDYHAYYVEERPARGWDTRLTGYLPFYPNLAVTGAVEKWYGRNVGAFGHKDELQSDPTVWAAGLAWTPVPAMTVSADRRFASGHGESRAAMTFNYRFGIPLADQLRPEMVADMRSLAGSRHDFVDRQYEMVLEYRAKPGRFRVDVIPLGNNTFRLQITDGLGRPVSGQTVIIGG